MVNGNKLGNAGFQYLGVPYSQMDCQAFVEQCLRDCGKNINLPGSNAWYREVMKNGAVMTPEECVQQLGKVPDGAFLFILLQDGGEPDKYKPDGIGNASHIGICTGSRGKGAIHSSASRGCVCESEFHGKTIKNGGWNRVGLWDQVAYDYGPAPGPSPEPDPGPSPEPEPPVHEYATVWSEDGKPVNTRKGPGVHYPLSKAGKLPVGTAVEILAEKDEWNQIRVEENGVTWICWIMDRFLIREEPEPGQKLYTVTIPHLTKDQAEALCNEWNGATKKEE